MRVGAAWAKFMKENWSRQSHAPAKATGDKTGSLLSYARPLEASTNAFIALKAAWNLLLWDWEGYGYQTTRPVEGGRIVDLRKRSGRDLDPTLKNDSLGGRMQTASPEFKSHPKPWVEIENKQGTHRGYAPRLQVPGQ
jgi:hypothetical protein